MAVTLSVGQVEALTGVEVTAADITLAAQLVDEQTGYTPDEHNTSRAVPVLTVQAAWSMVAVRVNRMLHSDGTEAVSSESQGDYQYTESVTLAQATKFSNVCDGRPMELLGIHRARWAHI